MRMETSHRYLKKSKKRFSEMRMQSPRELGPIQAACRIAAETLQLIRMEVGVGVVTRDLDTWAEEYIRDAGCKPAYKKCRNYPATLCTSVNHQIVHGIPSDYSLKNGDLLSVDVGVNYKGCYGDAATTICIGDVDEKHRLLTQVTEEALYKGIEQAVAGNRLSVVSHAVQTYAEQIGFAFVRDFMGHGLGVWSHEETKASDCRQPGEEHLLKEGIVITIESMVNEHTPLVRILPDGWTAATIDKGYSAHFTHTVLVTKENPEILTRITDELRSTCQKKMP